MKAFPIAALLAVACGHAPASPSKSGGRSPDAGPPPGDPQKTAAELSDEAHALFRAEGDLLWKRWTTGSGPMPASALAEHPQLAQRDSLDLVTAAGAKATGADAQASRLLRQQIATLAVAREAGAEIDALERARAQLVFAAPGDARPEHGERDLDRMLADESSAQKRAAIAQAESQAAQPLPPLVLARDAAIARAIASLRLGSWSEMEERTYGMPIAELAALAQKTLDATEEIAAAAVAEASVRNLGVTLDRLRRADLPRLSRSALADPQFPPGHAWPAMRDVLELLGLEIPAALQVDAEPSPSKGGRPLALLVDPPRDVRLSLRPAGGFDEQRATFHEGARALGGSLTQAPRWELAQLGDGSAAEGVAQLFEELAGDPAWLREATQLRGEPLDDLVHTQAARRLLETRRAAAMVLFETRRRDQPADAQAKLYRGLLQRATFATMTDDDAARWALEADTWTRAATPLLGAILGAQIEKPAWWKSRETGALLRKVWAGGRSLTAQQAARSLGIAALDPSALAAVAAAQLAYKAP
ncbi:MAG: hypothetical protein LC689_05260, partial [Myxococcales bacterium]|nr:hypothetical protein [Myxococcales bacterium]